MDKKLIMRFKKMMHPNLIGVILPFEYSSIEDAHKDFKALWKEQQGETNTFLFMGNWFDCIDFIDLNKVTKQGVVYVAPTIQTLDEWFEQTKMKNVRKEKIKKLLKN